MGTDRGVVTKTGENGPTEKRCSGTGRHDTVDLQNRSAMANHGRLDQRKSASVQHRCEKGADNDQAIGRSRGGLTTKVHAAADEKGRPIKLLLSKGNLNDITLAPQLVDGLTLAECFILADKGYDKEMYKCRNLVECFFNRMKQFRRFATRYEKTARSFLALVHLVAVFVWLAISRL